MAENIPKAKNILNVVLNSYSQVFFSKSKLLAVFLVIISFFDYGAGLGGIIAVAIANTLAWTLGYNKYLLQSGLYGFNALLVGLGIGLFYQPSIELYLLVAIAAVICFFFTIVFQGILGKYGLPFLSVPFLLTIWIIALSGNSLTALNISERSIFIYNELYALGGLKIVDLYNLLENSIGSPFIKVYFHSLAAIFFQHHLLAGIIIAAGLLIYSRITFVLSILGYSVAFLFYQFVGIEFNSLNYTFIGFNYILTSIALGGYYLVPNRVSYGWIILLLPAVVLIAIGTQQILLLFKISPYSLPFNMVVLMFLYALKLREKRPKYLVETPVQLGKPEQNLYLQSGNVKRFPTAFPISASLPFYGEWKVSQAHNGEHTHKGAWRFAWDFIVVDTNDAQFKNSGNFAEDYFCFGKTVLAPFDGAVIETIDNIPDNKIGDINTRENWGNTVIIKHNDYLYAKLSHLKYHSVEVKTGDQIKQGEAIGRCGNSGRSPYPHLHFQFQATPYIGSPTIDYPFSNYLLKEGNRYQLKTFENPLKDALIAKPVKNQILQKALHFIPGQQINGIVEVESGNKKWQKIAGSFSWVVETDVFNTTYIRSKADNGRAYLYNNGDLHYFTNYNGKKNKALFWFFAALYKVPLGFLPNSKISDSIPLNMMFGGVLKVLQDFVAPVFLFLKVDYELTIKEASDILASGDVAMSAQITKRIGGRKTKRYHCKVTINDQKEIEISILTNKTKIKIQCINELE
ncbi:MAG: urea transporter [Dysgonamonadaceae bacterium]|nr:urea transporter [Dysgonamonadaceae bacterium]